MSQCFPPWIGVGEGQTGDGCACSEGGEGEGEAREKGETHIGSMVWLRTWVEC